jgi:hypothetical protein
VCDCFGEFCRKRRVRLRGNVQAIFLPPSPPAEKAATRQDQAGKASTGDGAGNYRRIDGVQKYIAGVIGRGDIQELKTPRIVNVESSLATIARARNRAGENRRTTRKLCRFPAFRRSVSRSLPPFRH